MLAPKEVLSGGPSDLGLALFDTFYCFQKVSSNYGNSHLLNTDYVPGICRTVYIAYLFIPATTQYYGTGDLRPTEVKNSLPGSLARS